MLKDKIERKIREIRSNIGAFVIDFNPRLSAMIGLTYYCQGSCRHCGMSLYKKNKRNELTTNEILGIIDQLFLIKTRYLWLFGGEPLLRNDIFDLINYAKKKSMRVFLDTNGYLLTSEVAEKLKKAGLTLVHISIDSPCPEEHNAWRGMENSFERAIEGAKSCVRENIFCSLSTCATRENIKNGDLKKIILLGKKLGLSRTRVLSPILIGRWFKDEERVLSRDEKKILRKFREFGPMWIEEEHCFVTLKKFFYISPYGEVQPCCYIPMTFGNIRKEPLNIILARMWKHPLFSMEKRECPMNNSDFRKKYFSDTSLNEKFPIDFN